MSGTGTSSDFVYGLSPSRLRGLLEPLIQRLGEYDLVRARLGKEGGKVGDLRVLTQHLVRPISLCAPQDTPRVALSTPEELRRTLERIGARDVYLSVRVRPTGLPAYYLVRAKHGYWSEYSLLVEDLYMSPDYPLPDPRFVKLMDRGHETYFLRLSQFRAEISSGLREEPAERDWRVDDVLHNVGWRIFQAAWHEDQHPAFEAATRFGLGSFQQAIELLYLCLSGDLCAIRASMDSSISDFFASVYPQPAIREFLGRIAALEGKALARLPDEALGAFAGLSRAYTRFLRVEVSRSPSGGSVPLYKLLFSNFGRLEAIASPLRGDSALIAVGERLEARAQQVIQQIAYGV